MEEELVMVMKTQTWTWGLAGTLVVAAVAAAWAQGAMTLSVKGAVVSRSVRMVDGQPFVPLRDVAKMVGGSLAKAGGGYVIQEGDAAGGANQVSGKVGAVGQAVFDGFWRVTADAPQVVDSYQSKYQENAQTYTPRGDADELVIVPCVFKNGRKSTEYWYPGGDTALTDDQGQAYPSIGCDMRHGTGGTSPNILPGAGFNAVLVFSVPKGAKLKDLVITTDPAGDHGKPANLRISVAQ